MGVLLCLYYNIEYMTDIVTFLKIFRRIFWGSGAEERRRFLTVFGGEVGWASRSEQPFGGGTKHVPKTDA